MRVLVLFLSFFISIANAVTQPQKFPYGTHEILIPNIHGVRADLLQNITQIVDQSIAEGYYPGAVVLVAHRGHIIYKGVFGNRRIVPDVAPMQFNTIFDLASLTKVVATAPAVMQLVEQGKLSLDEPVTKYWPAFFVNGKETITIRELLTHTSGLPADLPFSSGGKAAALKQIENIKPGISGSAFIYSDINFIVLAHLVSVITHESFDRYVQDHIFKPLGMHHTSFLPPVAWLDNLAPTETINGKLRWGTVDDPSAYAMGGVAGNAGLFSDAHDLAIYAEWLLNGGRVPNRSNYILSPLTILKMTTPQTPKTIVDARGLGWDIDSSFSNRGVFFPLSSYGHTGWTGTSIWIDPTTKTWVIILTSRTHPKPASDNKLLQDRSLIANIVAASITDVPLHDLRNTGEGELKRAYKD